MIELDLVGAVLVAEDVATAPAVVPPAEHRERPAAPVGVAFLRVFV